MLLFALHVWMRRQPVGIDARADEITIRNRDGSARRGHIAGCAQIGGRLLALSFIDERGRARLLIVACDAIDADAFRHLARAARTYRNACNR